MTTLRRVPIGGWKRCVHQAASFESRGEFKAACLLDATDNLDWWLRNDPPLLRIPTPVGYFEPDFVYRRRRGMIIMGLLEIRRPNKGNGGLRMGKCNPKSQGSRAVGICGCFGTGCL